MTTADRFSDPRYTAWHAEQDGVLDEYLAANDLPAIEAPAPTITIEDIAKIVPASLSVKGRRYDWEITYTDHNWRPLESFRVAYNAPLERLDELAVWVDGVMARRPESPKLGRPEIGPQIKVRLPEEVIARVDALATEAGVSRSEWVRQAVTAAADSPHP